MKKTELEKELENHKKLLDDLTSMVNTLKWVVENPKQIEVRVCPDFVTAGSSTTAVRYDSNNIQSTFNLPLFQSSLKLKYYIPSSISTKTLDAVVVRDGTLNLLDYSFNKETGEFTCQFKVNALNGKQHYKYAVNLYGPINCNTIKLSYVCAGNKECPAAMYHVENVNRVHIS